MSPLIIVNKNLNPKKQDVPAGIRRMSNRRKYLLRIEQCKKDGHHLPEIRALNKYLLMSILYNESLFLGF